MTINKIKYYLKNNNNIKYYMNYYFLNIINKIIIIIK